MADWKDILSDKEEQLSDEELLKYLDENISDDEKVSIENKLNNSDFEADALQGLLQVQDKDNLQKHVNHLNQKLHQLTSRRQRKEKKKIKIFEWIVLTILLLLFICIICYIFIVLQHKTHVQTQILDQAVNYFQAI
jgi:hypothetical protein